MASYLASNMRRDTVALILSKAEAEALRALSASTNTSARRAGFFD